uniref:TANC1/2-like AAA+ ATPase lid domain-containing protein n=1 Tax=Strigamia maritima TaxID=126957 RepID=T1JLZ2_STRMM
MTGRRHDRGQDVEIKNHRCRHRYCTTPPHTTTTVDCTGYFESDRVHSQTKTRQKRVLRVIRFSFKTNGADLTTTVSYDLASSQLRFSFVSATFQYTSPVYLEGKETKQQRLLSSLTKVKDPDIQAAISGPECERNPDEAFKKAVVFPLLELEPPKQTLFWLVDSVDESHAQNPGEKVSGCGSRTIAELLSNHHQLLPPWLLLVCSARKQSKSVTRLFTGFRKISLDDLRKSHVVTDVQQYILCRLHHEENLRQHLSRETAEMLNQLHIKSNGCFLYLEKWRAFKTPNAKCRIRFVCVNIKIFYTLNFFPLRFIRCVQFDLVKLT